VSDLAMVLAVGIAPLALILWALDRRLNPAMPPDPPPPLWELHPADVWHRRYLVEQAFDRGLRASARRAGLLTVPASAWIAEGHEAGALTPTPQDWRRWQDRAFDSYAQPFRRAASNVVRVWQDGGRP